MEKKQKPIRIGPLVIDNPFILAPLAGYSDLPFRQLCREQGAGMCCSEMISSHGLIYRQTNTLALTRTAAAERPVAMQIFGSEPEIMAEAAAILSSLPIDLIDINMGCPVRKVIKKGAGAALMKNPALAEKIIRAVVGSTSLPVTVKTRIGWSHNDLNVEDFARMAEAAGAAAVAIHARTWTDGFTGKTMPEMIARVKRIVAIPVIGNGDIHSHEDGWKMMAQTGCDGVMIGRAALGNPFIFSPQAGEASMRRRLAGLGRHLELTEQYFPAGQMLAKIKNHASKYFRGIPGSGTIRQEIFACRSFTALRDYVASAVDSRLSAAGG